MPRPSSIIALGVVTGLGLSFMFSKTAQAAAGELASSVGIKAKGERNNNPGNIEWVDDPKRRWRGMIGKDGRYGIFDTAANGVRAIGGELNASIRKGQNTVAAIITEWAPPEENPTAAYIRNVANYCNVGDNEVIDVHARKPDIAYAIIRQELGYVPYSREDIATWVNLA